MLPASGASAQTGRESTQVVANLAAGAVDWEYTGDGEEPPVGPSAEDCGEDADCSQGVIGQSLVVARDIVTGEALPSEADSLAPVAAWKDAEPPVLASMRDWADDQDSAFLVVCDPDVDLQHPVASTESASIIQVKDAAHVLRSVEEALEHEKVPFSQDVLFSVGDEKPADAAITPATKAFEAVSQAGDLDVAPDVVLIDTGAPADCPNVIGAVSLLPGDETIANENGHATAMAEIICAENPDATIFCIKAADATGVGQLSSVYAALEYAIALNPRVISFSMTARNAQARDVCAHLVNSAAEKGISVVAAAGNEGRDAAGTALGGIECAVVVGACDMTGAKLPASNWGESVDWYAVGASTSHAAAKVAGILSACDYEDLEYADGVFSADYHPTENEQVVEDAQEAVEQFVIAANTGPVVGVYRSFHFTISDHYYSTSSSAPSGYTMEGEVWKAPSSSSTPVYQYHWNLGKTLQYDTYYSTSSTRPNSSYVADGIAFYSDDCQMVPIYRNYLSGTNNHLYVTDQSEGLSTGYVSEGLSGFYGLSSYTVAFNGNGNTGGSTSSQTMYYGITANLNANGFTKSHYHFTGWATSSSGSVAYANKASVSTLNATNGGTTTLYAKWAVDTYNQKVLVRYQNADGSWGSYSTVINTAYGYGSTCKWSRAQDATYNAASISYTVTSANTKYVDVSRRSAKNTIQVRYQNGDGTYGSYSTVSSGTDYVGATRSWSRSADATYKAASATITGTASAQTKQVSVVRKSYTTSFDSCGGSAVSSYSRLAGSRFVVPTAPTRQGYVFDGWWTLADGGTAVTSSTVTPSAAVTYYAHWSKVISMPVSGLRACPIVLVWALVAMCAAFLLALGMRRE